MMRCNIVSRSRSDPTDTTAAITFWRSDLATSSAMCEEGSDANRRAEGQTGSVPVRVFLLDDHEIVRRGLRDLIEAEPDLVVVGEAGTAEEAVARIPATSPDVAVLDVRLPDGDGIEVC